MALVKSSKVAARALKATTTSSPPQPSRSPIRPPQSKGLVVPTAEALFERVAAATEEFASGLGKLPRPPSNCASRWSKSRPGPRKPPAPRRNNSRPSSRYSTAFDRARRNRRLTAAYGKRPSYTWRRGGTDHCFCSRNRAQCAAAGRDGEIIANWSAAPRISAK